MKNPESNVPGSLADCVYVVCVCVCVSPWQNAILEKLKQPKNALLTIISVFT